jgi:hypothetical protein
MGKRRGSKRKSSKRRGSYKKRRGSYKKRKGSKRRLSRKKWRKYRSTDCSGYKRSTCGSDPGCHWVKKKGCSKRRGVGMPLRAGGVRYHGPINKVR